MPSLGMAPGDVYLAEWLVEAGAAVAAGDVIALIETDKAELSIEAEVAGTLSAHLVDVGDLAAAGSVIAWVLEPGEVAPSAAGSLPKTTVASMVASDEVPQVATKITPSKPGEGEPVAKAVVHRSDRSRDLSTRELTPYTVSPRDRSSAAVTPTAKSAPIDQTHALTDSGGTAAPANADRYRNAVARAVARSWAEIPHFAVTRELRVEKLHEVLRSYRILKSGVSLTDVLLKAYALSLVERFDTTEINLGLAVATPNGVAIPVIPAVATTDILSIARLRQAAIERSLAGQLSQDDGAPAHSTLSNLGAYGVDSFTAIVPLGQTSILSVGASALRPVVDNGLLGVGLTMSATLNVDHREWDGQHAALALQRLAAIAEEPAMLLTLTASR